MAGRELHYQEAIALRPMATVVLCERSGAPGGLFTPSLTVGALLGAVLGHASSWFWPGVPPGLSAMLGAASLLAATMQARSRQLYCCDRRGATELIRRARRECAATHRSCPAASNRWVP